MTVIYQPSGRAAEYADWACNLFRGCPHQCAYCFAPSVLRMKKYEFHKRARPRTDIIWRLASSADNPKYYGAMVHLCFTCDPYPLIRNYLPPDQRAITREAITILKRNGMGIQILTKGGMDSIGDLDLLDPSDEYAATLTFADPQDSRLWEPHAALPTDRLEALLFASERVTTWASLEPVIYPDQSLELLEAAIDAGISKVKVGPLNYKGRLPKWLADTVPELDMTDWRDFVDEVKLRCRRANVEVILKNDLKKLAGLA